MSFLNKVQKPKEKQRFQSDIIKDKGTIVLHSLSLCIHFQKTWITSLLK